MQSIEKTGRTVEEAIEAALSEMELTIDQVETEVIERESKGLFGFIGNKPAIVKITKKFDPVSVARIFLKEVFTAMELIVDINIELKDEKHMFIELKGENMRLIIGKRGQTLDSLQYLTNLVVNKGEASYVSITMDTENYRQRRKDTLESLARNLAKKAKATHKRVVLEPMSPYERRIIHSMLQNDRYVTTHSEGDEPFRYVVIVPKEYTRRSNTSEAKTVEE